MSRILLADDSSHAQRMGEGILREEGFEVVSVTDGDTAVFRLADVDPDVILADVLLPGKSGYELCRYVRSNSRFHHTRVVLTAGALEPFDEDEARGVQADGSLRKPFEASSLLDTVKRLAAAAERARAKGAPQPDSPDVPLPDPELVRAAITLALEAAMPVMIEEVSSRVLGSFERYAILPHSKPRNTTD